MKRLLKAMARTLWKLSGPVRRPLLRKLDAHVAHLVARASAPHVAAQTLAELAPRLDALAQQAGAIHALRHETNRHMTEIDLTLDSLVREVTRLQGHVEALQDQLDGAGDLPVYDGPGLNELRQAG